MRAILGTRVRERSKVTAKSTAGEGNTWHTCSRTEQSSSQAHSQLGQYLAHVSENGAKLENSSRPMRAALGTRVRERRQVGRHGIKPKNKKVLILSIRRFNNTLFCRADVSAGPIFSEWVFISYLFLSIRDLRNTYFPASDFSRNPYSAERIASSQGGAIGVRFYKPASSVQPQLLGVLTLKKDI